MIRTMMTTESGSNIAANNYHFVSKYGLYRAVLEQLVEDTEAYFEPSLTTLQETIIAASNDPQKLVEAVTAIAAGVSKKSVHDPECAIRAHAILGQIFVFGIASIGMATRPNTYQWSPK